MRTAAQEDMNSSGTQLTSVLVIDDSSIVGERLCGLLRERGSLEVVGWAGSAVEAWRLFSQRHPAAVVLDVKLCEDSGIELLRRIKAADPSCVVLVLTNYCDLEFEEECRRQGADFFLHKASDFEKAADLLCDLSPRQAGRAGAGSRTGAARTGPSERLLERLAPNETAAAVGAALTQMPQHLTP